MTNKPPKLKKCRICACKFTPIRNVNVCASHDCQVTYAMALIEKNNRLASLKIKRDDKQAKDKLKTRSTHFREAQTVFNQFIRLRDGHLPCISCNRYHTGQYHAGHYRSLGSAPHLRFNELNCHRQCSICNNHLSANLIEYRKGLIAKIGMAEVEQLEADQAPKKYTIDEIKAIKQTYKQKFKLKQC